ncbi:hypothetical protein Dacet_2481 [Denitrovibrio acetiphilus DSM 12809]|uniref:Lipoprotein n=1 Tax=Denitrovibrio acetiphilus (strain DSM 12809 / NBRC 114555 / N2460) TaxID=522772 RepID=D4H4B2_DENA2|nr:hypothetical protein [Denitrovibrio acetiphilus]ADD69241.1 hypothetical protein Dacet_2481 [Denitrovibrio acetiphilus DSM 12809]
MKKLFPVLILSIFFAGCVDKAVNGLAHTSTPRKVETFVDDKVLMAQQSLTKILKPSYGYTYMLIAIELNSNASSLIIDKTKEKVISFDSQVVSKLTPGSFFYVIPPKVSDGETFEYNEEFGRMIRNYLTMAKYGVPVSDPEDAEYIVVSTIRESLDKSYGTNYSQITFSIVDKFDYPVYLASIRVESKSDRNFWYFPTKKAKPVRKLTMKGMTKIMAEGLPNVHGDPTSLLAMVEKKVEDRKVAKETDK